jgi:hypothetical protein
MFASMTSIVYIFQRKILTEEVHKEMQAVGGVLRAVNM